MLIRKLVRANIPALMKKDGTPFRVLEFKTSKTKAILLLDKLDEEIAEVKEAYGKGNMENLIEELADLEEVLEALKQELDVSSLSLLRVKGRKLREKGGFKKAVYIQFDTDDLPNR